MINIAINGEKVIITAHNKLSDMLSFDAYNIMHDGKLALVIPNERFDPRYKDLDKKKLYLVGIIVTDKAGNIEVVEDEIIFNNELAFNAELDGYLGVYIENGDFDYYDHRAGIKIFFEEE